MTNDELAFATIEELSPLVAGKKISPVELARLCLSRIAEFNPRLNAFLTVTAESALAAARAAERELLRGHCRGPLHGIPIALKDNIWTRGVRTTAGSTILRDFVPEADATVTRKLRRAGAVLLGKTNMHEFAYGITSENPHYGATRNPWDPARISGGSSGGSAAAIAAGMCFASVGTDTGGSIRVPAALCGIVGLKPTFGRVSRYGVVPLALSFDHVGPAGAERRGRGAAAERYCGTRPARCRKRQAAARGFRTKRAAAGANRGGWGGRGSIFGRNSIRKYGGSRKRRWRDLVKEGATVEDVSLPNAGAPLSRRRTSLRLPKRANSTRARDIFRSARRNMATDVRGRLQQGGEVRAVDYWMARALMERSRAEFAAALATVDAIVAPASPIAAPLVGSERVRVGDGEETVRGALVRLNRPSNFTGLPAMSVPCGFTKDGLPVGLQLIGRAFDEGTLLGIARSYEEVHKWRSAHPPLASK